ncbi:hypothetical protein Goshw_003842, partial [Gossypium schwendimanii]|nr:hypothetical protein [Gossypium schwendimanii]
TLWSAEEWVKVSYSWAKQYTSLNKARQLVSNLVTPLPENWIQLNIDGAIKGEIEATSIGGSTR